MPGEPITLDEAVNLTRTGDVWVFRGASLADRAIQTLTNAPVNHVGMAVVLDDMPPLSSISTGSRRGGSSVAGQRGAMAGSASTLAAVTLVGRSTVPIRACSRCRMSSGV